MKKVMGEWRENGVLGCQSRGVISWEHKMLKPTLSLSTVRRFVTSCGFTLFVGVTCVSIPAAQEKPALSASERASRPLVSVPTILSLEEARVIIEAATAVVRADKGRAAIAVVDYNGNLVSLDSMDGTSGFWVKFAVGKAVGAAALQQSTAESS